MVVPPLVIILAGGTPSADLASVGKGVDVGAGGGVGVGTDEVGIDFFSVDGVGFGVPLAVDILFAAVDLDGGGEDFPPEPSDFPSNLEKETFPAVDIDSSV